MKPKRELPGARLIERHGITSDLTVLRLLPEIPFAFEPGQYCTIGLEGIERPYSIVSSPHEPYIELFIELVPHGELTPKLWVLRVGETVSLRPHPKGVFTLKQGFASHLMVATTTGIAPFVSMLRSALHRGDRRFRFFVLHGASYQDEFAYREELESVNSRHPDFMTYVPTVSRPREERNRDWSGVTGRVNLASANQVERFGLLPPSTMAYACGHPEMIRDVTERLGSRGFVVEEEKYWKE